MRSLGLPVSNIKNSYGLFSDEKRPWSPLVNLGKSTAAMLNINNHQMAKTLVAEVALCLSGKSFRATVVNIVTSSVILTRRKQTQNKWS